MEQQMDTDALLAVCRTAYRRVMAEPDGNLPAVKDAVGADSEIAPPKPERS